MQLFQIMIKRIAIVVLFVGLALSAQSRNVHWTGALSTNWHAADNWLEGEIPSCTDRAVFDQGHSTGDCLIEGGTLVGGILLNPGFSHSVIQASASCNSLGAQDSPITVGVLDFVLLDGTFKLGKGDVIVLGHVNIDGATFSPCDEGRFINPNLISAGWPSECNWAPSEYAYHLKKELDADVAHAWTGNLEFYFRDDHLPNQEVINFSLYNNNNELMYQTGNPALTKLGYNIYSLDLRGLHTGTTNNSDLYLLVVTDVTGHQYKLKFEVNH